MVVRQKTLEGEVSKSYNPFKRRRIHLHKGVGEKDIYNIFSESGFLVSTISGLPDLILIKNGIIQWIEVKKNKKRVIRRSQIEGMRLLTSIGHKCYLYFCEEKEIVPFHSDFEPEYENISCNVFLRHNKPTGEIPLDILFILKKLNEEER